MNFQCSPILNPLRVLVVNPLSMAAQLTITKIMSGVVFGENQLVDLILLVYSNETRAAEDFKLELFNCGFSCINTIEVSSDMPRLLELFSSLKLTRPTPFSKLEFVELKSDADIFCFITNFRNPNRVNFSEIDEIHFDVLYMIIKIAIGLSEPVPVPDEKVLDKPWKKPLEEKIRRRPLIVADGIVTLNILNYFTNGNIPFDVFFCPTPLTAMAKLVLGDHLKVKANVINNVFVWGADDDVFHIEIDKPIIKEDKVDVESRCDWNMIGRDLMEKLNLDITNFSESWMKKDFVQRVHTLSLKNPYGDIYRASDFAKTLNTLWKARCAPEGVKITANLGVITNGVLQTHKGCGYVFPLLLSGDTWSVSKLFNENSHVQQEIKRMNITVANMKEKLIPYCKKFKRENVIDMAFVPTETGSSLSYARHSSPVNSRTIVRMAIGEPTDSSTGSKIFGI